MATGAPQRILLTRSEDDCAVWAAALREQGRDAVELPCITAEIIDTGPVRKLLAQAIPRADWIVFTSRRGVAVTGMMLGPTRLPRHIRVAAVGTATASAAQRQLRRVDYIANGATASSLADELVDRLDGPDKPALLLILAENAPDVLQQKLRAAGHATFRVNVYRTIAAPPRESKKRYSDLGCDAVFLASPSAVTGLVNQVEFDVDPEIFTIGPSTSAAVEGFGLAVAGQAAEPSLNGLLEASR